jgi:hypothetical protein
MNYTDFFQFFLHIPIAVFEEISDKQIKEDCLEMAAYPLVIIREPTHPLFIRLAEDFIKKGVKQDLKLIILAIGYNTPYLS